MNVIASVTGRDEICPESFHLIDLIKQVSFVSVFTLPL